MKKQHAVIALVLALAAPLALAAETPQGAPVAAGKSAAPDYKTKKLNKAEVDALLAHPEKLLIIDVRRPDELTKIGGFPVYLSIPAKDLEKSLAYIPKDRDIITVSNHAARSGRAGDLLTSKGFKVVGTVGVQNYEEEGGKLTKILPPEPKPPVANN